MSGKLNRFLPNFVVVHHMQNYISSVSEVCTIVITGLHYGHEGNTYVKYWESCVYTIIIGRTGIECRHAIAYCNMPYIYIEKLTHEYAHVGSQELLFYLAENPTRHRDNTVEKHLQRCQLWTWGGIRVHTLDHLLFFYRWQKNVQGQEAALLHTVEYLLQDTVHKVCRIHTLHTTLRKIVFEGVLIS